jgi:hypothetical protein
LRDSFPDGGDIVLRWANNRADYELAAACTRDVVISLLDAAEALRVIVYNSEEFPDIKAGGEALACLDAALAGFPSVATGAAESAVQSRPELEPVSVIEIALTQPGTCGCGHSPHPGFVCGWPLNGVAGVGARCECEG